MATTACEQWSGHSVCNGGSVRDLYAAWAAHAVSASPKASATPASRLPLAHHAGHPAFTIHNLLPIAGGLLVVVIVLLVWLLRSRPKSSLPPIVAFVGPPGVGKTYCMASWLLKQMQREGRLGLSQFAVDGAVPLVHLHDLLHRLAGGAAVCLDEAGRIFPAREWQSEDDIEQLVIETIRHYGQTLVVAVHSPQDVGVHFRRRVGLWVTIERDGPDPSIALTLGKQVRRRDMPKGFRLTAYRGAEPPDYVPSFSEKNRVWRDHLPFDLEVARKYDTGERIFTDAQERVIAQLLEGAEDRLTAAPWRVTMGKSESAARRLIRGRDRERRQSERIKQAAAGAPVAGLSADDLAAIADALEEPAGAGS